MLLRTSTRAIGVAVAAAALGATFFTGMNASAAQTLAGHTVRLIPPTTSSTTSNTTPLSLGWGVAEPDWPASAAGLSAAQAVAGRTANIVMNYAHWSDGWSTWADWLPDVTATLQNGSTPMLTWMSDAVDLRQIAAGYYDSYVRSWANGVRAVGHTVYIRFDSEMNGNWMPYSPGYSGNSNSTATAADYVAAWRHIYNVFRSAGASNASWVWSPNVQYPGSAPLAPLYPGDSYVNWVALDGYNWGTTYGHTWQTFAQVFYPSVSAVEQLTSRPLMIAETASTEVGGDKAAWITDMFQQLASRSDIRGFIWFDYNKETDWRIASSPASAAAFAQGMSTFKTR